LETFVFPGWKALMIMGIAEIVLGILLIMGLLKGRRSGLVGRIIGGIVLIAFGIFFLTMRDMGEIRLEEGVMHLKVPFQRDKIVTTADIIGVREVDFSSGSGFRPVRKISGGNAGDVRTGWYKLANGEKAFLTVKGKHALYLETSLGFPVLVGATDFDSFSAAFTRYVHTY
jgi:hypothetical protein